MDNPEKKATKPKVVAIVGPNASGKSDIAVEIAHKFGGEVISADSRQVYRGLDLSSGKVPGSWKIRGFRRVYEYQDIPHHLIDVASPRKIFTVQKYKKKAQKTISSILEREKLPILAGGTGFYIDTVLYDMDIPEVPPNRKLRSELASLSNEELMQRLRGLDPNRAESVDSKNRRRIVRAIEIVVSSGSPVPDNSFAYEDSPYEILKIGLELKEEDLRHKIAARLDRRIKDGFINELKWLHLRGLSWRRLEKLGFEFKHVSQYIRGEIDMDQLKDLINKQSWQYAKRQMTWFKKDPNTIWINAPAKASQLVRDFLGHAA